VVPSIATLADIPPGKKGSNGAPRISSKSIHETAKCNVLVGTEAHPLDSSSVTHLDTLEHSSHKITMLKLSIPWRFQDPTPIVRRLEFALDRMTSWID
jgi:hypothetical protein